MPRHDRTRRDRDLVSRTKKNARSTTETALSVVRSSADERRRRARVLDHVGEDLVERAGRLPADRAGDLVDRGLPVEHVLDPLAVDLVVRHIDDLRGRARQLDHAPRELVDRDALGRADVQDLARHRRRVHQPRERADRVLHVAEAARLRAVAVNLERAVAERRRDEPRDHHSVLAALPRPDGVEEARNHAVEPALLVVRERQELVERLRLRVCPAPRRRRPVDAAALLCERLRLAPVAVDLGRRRDEHALPELVAVVEDVLRALDVRDERAHRLLDDQPHADRRGEVIDDVAAVHELVHDRRLEHGVDDEVEVAALAQVCDVPLGAGGQVVEDEDLPAVGEQELREMRADEAGPAGDQGTAARSVHAHGRDPSRGL